MALLAFTIVLVLVAGCGGYLLKRVRSSLRHVWPRPRQAPKSDGLPIIERWHHPETLRSYLRALPARPLFAAPVLVIAALLAINVHATAEKSDLRNFARLVQHAHAKDQSLKQIPAYSRYELVSLQPPMATGGREHLVRLRSTGRFVLYYDVLEDEPLVVPVAAAASQVADAGPSVPAPRADVGGELPEALPDATGAMGVPGAASANGTAPAAPRTGPAGGSDSPIRTAQSQAGKTASPAGATANPSQIAPPAMASEKVGAEPAPKPDERLAMATTTAGDSGPAAAPPDGVKLAQQASAAAGQAIPQPEIDAIGTGLRGSQGSLDGLKSNMQQLQTSVGEIQKFIDELDGSLQQIGQAFGQLSDLQAAAAQLAYADCPELTTRRLAFAADDATLSLEAVGWLFQSRRQLAAARSPDRQEWLVIEGHAGGPGEAGAPPPLAIQRADAVRDFLQSELGVPADSMQVVGKSVSEPDANLVSLYDCGGRGRAAAAPAEPGAVRSTAAREASGDGSVRPAAWTTGDAAGGLQAMLADLNPRPEAHGLLVTLPGDRLFDTNSARIRPSAYDVLGQIGTALAQTPTPNAVIIGHSDAIGAADYNLALSQQRARAVRDYLVDHFKIEADRLAVEGRGEDDPIATDETPAGRSANRRIDLLLVD
jgi:outer membrane protein OmpA-like peptidoglycan-associated protein